MHRFEHQVVLVTGGSSGIGYATASAFLREGARVAIIGRNDSNLRKAYTALKVNGDVLSLRGDVSRVADAKRFVSQTTKAFGPIDVLVNNAGIYFYSTLLDTSEEAYDRQMDTNLKGAFLCTKYVLPAMMRHGRGVIVNIASESAHVATVGSSAYCASKAAMVALTKVTALEHARDGIRANVICPGEVITPMMMRDAAASGLDFQRYYRRLVEPIPVHRAAKPEEIASVVLFLASSDSSFMTGATVNVDGGATIVSAPQWWYEKQ